MEKLGRQLLTVSRSTATLGCTIQEARTVPQAPGLQGLEAPAGARNGTGLSEGKLRRPCNYRLHPNALACGAELRLPGKLHVWHLLIRARDFTSRVGLSAAATVHVATPPMQEGAAATGRAAPGGAPNLPWSSPRPGISTLRFTRLPCGGGSCSLPGANPSTPLMPRYAAQGLLDL